MKIILVLLTILTTSCWMTEKNNRFIHHLDGPVDTVYSEKYMFLKFKCVQDSCDYYEYYKKPKE